MLFCGIAEYCFRDILAIDTSEYEDDPRILQWTPRENLPQDWLAITLTWPSSYSANPWPSIAPLRIEPSYLIIISR